ncbi:hypothetical protein [Actinomadura madurae]|uniref:hypothetical protein n=1 Tax=Actinomadura madurae TaxID=1993 RepID=UPI002027560F|nr:hypothetical protein [Actinomadura madurae]MCP9980179.1 hypothetical protein [Actinomadura madurae]MCQ0016391.1 hypothetical protein [Actinomadura madurae]URM96488.1 hypothetical protein LUW76_20330 [Actinomadura madurae]URN07167.1 hypothetical protein LUW74_30150 [Actinomadura madurae]
MDEFQVPALAVDQRPDPAVYEGDEIEASPNAAGFEVDEVLDVPDRPGLERVFVARGP